MIDGEFCSTTLIVEIENTQMRHFVRKRMKCRVSQADTTKNFPQICSLLDPNGYFQEIWDWNFPKGVPLLKVKKFSDVALASFESGHHLV